uniref:hypothetical protein n=1 Tax=Bradyrhizobium sp. (strain ORS 278) TaxID=114615 RepID=UPI0012FF52F1|nr:hypothetical protein [Bradyrhizobium sp. ORS 278]
MTPGELKVVAPRPLTVAAAVIAIGVAGLGYVMWSVMDDFGACTTVEERSIPSPDRKSRIVVFGRACNATVPLTTQLSVAPLTGSFSPETYPPFFVTRDGGHVDAAWRSDGVIEVKPPADTVIYRQERNAGDIRIIYK